MKKIKDASAGVSAIEFLIYIIIAAAITIVVWMALSGIRGSADNFNVKDNLVKVSKMSRVLWMEQGGAIEGQSGLVSYLNGNTGESLSLISFDGTNSSTRSSEVTVSVDGQNQVTFCGKSALTKMVYCLRSDYGGELNIARIVPLEKEDIDKSFLAENNPITSLFSPEEAHAAVGTNKFDSKCAGVLEEDTRECLATKISPAKQVNESFPGWGSASASSDETGDPVDPPDPDPDPVPDPDPDPVPDPDPDPVPDPDPDPGASYDSVMDAASANRTTHCGFDEAEGNTFSCDNRDPGNLDPIGNTTLGEPGAIISKPGNKSMKFNGALSNTYSPQNGTTSIQGSNWSASIWAKPGRVSDIYDLVVSVDNRFGIAMQDSAGFMAVVRGSVMNEYDSYYSFIGTPDTSQQNPIVSGQWYFLVMTYENGTLRLYVNGQLVDGIENVPSGPVGDGNIRVGDFIGDNLQTEESNWLKGYVDEFNFYKRTLTAQEIADQYAAAGY